MQCFNDIAPKCSKFVTYYPQSKQITNWKQNCQKRVVASIESDRLRPRTQVEFTYNFLSRITNDGQSITASLLNYTMCMFVTHVCTNVKYKNYRKKIGSVLIFLFYPVSSTKLINGGKRVGTFERILSCSIINSLKCK